MVAAVRGVCSGAFEKRIEELEQRTYADPALADLKAKLVEAKQLVLKGIAFAKERGAEYTDLHGRRLVDAAIAVLIGHLFLGQAAASERKKAVAHRFIQTELPGIQRDITVVCSGDKSAMEQYDLLAGPVPAA